MPQPGTYRYYAQEWATFMRLVKDGATSFEDLERAFKGLGHLWIHTEAPSGDLDKINFEKSLEIAARLYTDRMVDAKMAR